ncbi:MAG: glycosyltransferase family 2 protein [Phycisphaerae bacterium]|nr:glycosyltransferase family 2 protein [Tepidisphaeraceae bacterium]
MLVLTKDEEANIAGCLECCAAFSDDIVVLDSESRDRTLEIARSYPNVRVFTRAFDTEWRQRNYGLHDVKYRNRWVYICDADERVPANLAAEILTVVTDPSPAHAAYRLRYKNMYLGRWIRHASPYPTWIMRLVRPELVTYERRETNVHPVVTGTIGELRGHFVHYSFNSGLARWFYKHNFYSTREAIEGVKVRRGGRPPLAAFRSGDPMVRRRALKNLSYFLIGRGFIRFVHMYVLRRGMLDGAAGFHYCAMIATYEYWIELKMSELESDWVGATNRTATRLLRGSAAPRPSTRAEGNRPPPRIDVMIPTFNEAAHIVEVVANAKTLGGGVYVLDSKSTDGTQDLARAAGATVVERTFTNYADQKNWGLDNLPFTGDWVFILDADERITPELKDEIFEKTASRRRTTGYFVNRVVIAMGKQVRHGGLYPSWNLRLFRRGTARYEERVVHEHMVSTGPVDFLHHEMLHLRRESISRFIDKHVRYADLEADEWVKWRTGNSTTEPARSLFKNVLAVRQWFRRNIWPRLPGRPLWRFVYMYFFRFGFLDGLAGWHMARLMACYEYMIGLLYAEKLAKLKGKDLGRAGGEHEVIGCARRT